MKEQQASLDRWKLLLQRCLYQRVGPDKFEQYARLTYSKTPIAGDQICSMVIPEESANDAAVDPLVPMYVEKLLLLRLIDARHILEPLLSSHKTFAPQDSGSERLQKSIITMLRRSELEHSLISCLVRVFSSSEFYESKPDIRHTLECMSAWMSHLADQTTDLLIQSTSSSAPSVAHALSVGRENIAALLLSYLCRTQVNSVLKMGVANGTTTMLASSLTSFIPVIALTQIALATRLHAIQKELPVLQPKKIPANGGQESRNDVEQVDPNMVADLQHVSTRASFYIYLEYLMSDLLNVSDHAMLSYLNIKYVVSFIHHVSFSVNHDQGDNSSAALGLIIAAFDVVASSQDGGQFDFSKRAYLVSKVPSLLRTLSSMSFVPIHYAALISQAFSQLGQSLFPAVPQGNEASSRSQEGWDGRAAFLSACMINGIVTEPEIEHILGDRSDRLGFDVKLLGRHALAAECKRDDKKLQELSMHTSDVDANTCPRIEALVEGLHTRCLTGDKQVLRSVSRSLSCDSKRLDAFVLFGDVNRFVIPLSRLLVEWKYEGQPQQAYDEFGACTLLILRISDRYNMSSEDIGLDEDTMLSMMMQEQDGPVPNEKLSHNQGRHLGDWIKALFDTKVINDELLSSCPVQDFYAMIPTIFQQTVLACYSNMLDVKTLKSGMDLLLETFLLPALIPGLKWLATQLRHDSLELSILLIMLTHLARSDATGGEAADIHSAIIKIVGPEVLTALDRLRLNNQNGQEVDSLYHSIESQLNNERHMCHKLSSLQLWTAPQRGSMIGSFRASFSTLCYWSSQDSIAPPMPQLTYSQIDATIQCAGARPVLNAIVEECRAQIGSGLGDIALDIGTAIIDSASSHRRKSAYESNEASQGTRNGRLTLRDALALAVQDPTCLTTADTLKAETLVRLHRRSTDFAAAVTAAQDNLMPMGMTTTEALMNDINLETNVAASGSANADALHFGHDGAEDLQIQDLETPATDAKGNLTPPIDASDPFAIINEQHQFTSAEDDIFGDLDLDESMQLGF